MSTKVEALTSEVVELPDQREKLHEIPLLAANEGLKEEQLADKVECAKNLQCQGVVDWKTS